MSDFEKKKQIDLILSQGIFSLDPSTDLSVRGEIFTWLVQRALYLLNKEFPQSKYNMEQIQSKIYKIINPELAMRKDDIPIELVQHGLYKSKKEGHIKTTEDYYYLSEERIALFEYKDKEFKEDREIFFNYFISNIKQEINLSKAQIEFLIEAFEVIIFEFINNQTFHIVQHIEANPGDNHLGIDTDDINNIEDQLRRKLQEKLKNDLIKIELIIKKFVELLIKMSSKEFKYLVCIFDTVTYNRILRIDPNLRKFQDDLLEKRIIYLDDNVVLTAMLTTHAENEMVVKILRDCQKLKIQLRITKEIIEEIEAKFRYSKALYDDKSKLFSERFKDSVVREYYEYKRIDWDDFEKYYLPIEKRFCVSFNVQVENECLDKEKFLKDERFPVFWKVFKENKDKKRQMYNGKEARDVTIDHDVINYLTIHCVREKYKKDVMGHMVWLVSRDKTLRISEQHLMHYYPHSYSKYIDEFIGMLLPYRINITTFVQQGDYIKHLIKSNLGKINNSGKMKLIDYIESGKVSIKNLIFQEPEVIQEIISDLQLNQLDQEKIYNEFSKPEPNLLLIANHLEELICEQKGEKSKEVEREQITIKELTNEIEEKSKIIENYEKKNEKKYKEMLQKEMEKHKDKSDKKIKRIIIGTSIIITGLFIIVIVALLN